MKFGNSTVQFNVSWDRDNVLRLAKCHFDNGNLYDNNNILLVMAPESSDHDAEVLRAYNNCIRAALISRVPYWQLFATKHDFRKKLHPEINMRSEHSLTFEEISDWLMSNEEHRSFIAWPRSTRVDEERYEYFNSLKEQS